MIDPIKLSKDLMRIPSINPPVGDYIPERKVANYLSDCMKSIGLEVEEIRYNHRPNLIGRKKFGKGNKSDANGIVNASPEKRILFLSHMDVVPIENRDNWKYDPFDPVEENGILYGRGSGDMKAAIACMLSAIENSMKKNLNGEIVFIASADEERASQYGASSLKENRPELLEANFAVIGESSNLQMSVAQKGFIRPKISVYGKSAHASRPQDGVNAILKAANIAKSVGKLKFNYEEHKLLSKPSINIGKIHGGEKVNIVPSKCELELDIRYLPGMEKEIILNQLKNEIEQIRRNDPEKWSYNIEVIEHGLPAESNMELCEYLAEKLNMKIIGKDASNDARFLDCPFAVIGPGDPSKSHKDNESIQINNIKQGVEIYESLIEEILQ